MNAILSPGRDAIMELIIFFLSKVAINLFRFKTIVLSVKNFVEIFIA